jgi:hypothetical protein
LSDTARRGWAQSRLAIGLATIGDLVEAQRLTGILADSSDRGEALSRLATLVPQREANRLLGETLAGSEWHLPLDALAAVHPAVVSDIADMLTAG